MLINAGISDIFFLNSYDDPLAEEMLEEAGIRLVRWEK
jgi:deoxycytidylate deaminase